MVSDPTKTPTISKKERERLRGGPRCNIKTSRFHQTWVNCLMCVRHRLLDVLDAKDAEVETLKRKIDDLKKVEQQIGEPHVTYGAKVNVNWAGYPHKTGCVLRESPSDVTSPKVLVAGEDGSRVWVPLECVEFI